ncbi:MULTISPECIES: hypothetical protein [unclassified Bradyrhizobium]|uniref:hypothetical protein n=1 Tax=unclassified Bradyrhizobium TaxID=2631580 RepID=UPI00247A62B6|nr:MULTISPECIES: hypothetical protein [unclassified Bradyrhizobium]WGR70175.1 hypothetical protein MTX24_33025 [Bradyrhizobium sp. ISRA426]WGR82232.1 hypothetical protein MTX21_18130 [Bradyrhizobium sp. ISRA430]WGR85418.1 hypothetical protein MTX25_32700 [Bradyrhizobium sp. ISRA432]
MTPRTMRGPGLFISQFIGAQPPFDTLSGLAEWARGLGFKALQIPLSDPRLKDLAGLPEQDALARIESVMSTAGLVVSEIAAQRTGQLLAVHPAYDETMDVLAAPDPPHERRRPSRICGASSPMSLARQ